LYEFSTEPSDGNAFDNNFLPINRSLRVEYDSCNMTSIVQYPIITGKDRNVLITNDDYKMRLTMTHFPHHNDLVIKKTCLGPSYGGHITKLRVVPGSTNDRGILAFSTGNKVSSNV
jgi:hypothetical protein